MRVLFVAMADSIHTARWIRQLQGQGWDLHLFPVERGRLHPELRDLTVQDAFGCDGSALPDSTRHVCLDGREAGRDRAAEALTAVVEGLRPDVVHSLELLKAGGLVLAALERLAGPRPPWMATNWGSEIALLGRLPQYAPALRRIVAACDYYTCECERDVALARAWGLRGEALSVLPIAGGFDLAALETLRREPTSSRRLVLLKGYQGWAGRALVGLRGLERAAEALDGYRVVLYSPADDVALAAAVASQETGIPIDIAGERSHLEMLALHGQARISIGLSLCDGLSTSFLEAMVMGSFPIQSDTGCAREWTQDGVNALFVHPNDADGVAAAVGRALGDDRMVDEAARLNGRLARERLDAAVVRPQAVALYERAAARRSPAAGP